MPSGKPFKTEAARVKAAAARQEVRKQKKELEKIHDSRLDEEIKKVGSRNKEIRDADLRLRLEGAKTIDRINMIIDEFTLLDQQLKVSRNTKKNPNRLRDRISKNTARGQILKTQSDMLFKKLNKLVPDIKSIEHNGTFKPSKPENMPEESLIDILTDNVPMEEITAMFPQYKDLLKTLENLELPDLPN